MAKELLFSVTKKDLQFETFRAGGKGGQKQNKTNSGVRVRHSDSGAVAESRTYAGQLENKKEAFRRLLETSEFVLWRKRRTAELLMDAQAKERRERDIEATVARLMGSENIRAEVQDENGDWIELGSMELEQFKS